MSRVAFGIFFIFVLLVMIGGFIWNVIVFQDCRSHGHAMYQCQAAMANPNYVAVEDISEDQ